MYSIKKDSIYLYEIKKSKFYTLLYKIDNEENIKKYLEEVKNTYKDATHYCYAYKINNLKKCSDDGEPSQTAGKPMLDVLAGHELCNVAAVVTRYFGGTLLGTGPLTRAYLQSAKEALNCSKLAQKMQGVKCTLVLDYQTYGKFERLSVQMQIPVNNVDYAQYVTVDMIVPVDKKNAFEKKLTDITMGDADITWYDTVSFAYSKENKTSMKYDVLCRTAESLPKDYDENPYSFREYFLNAD